MVLQSVWHEALVYPAKLSPTPFKGLSTPLGFQKPIQMTLKYGEKLSGSVGFFTTAVPVRYSDL